MKKIFLFSLLVLMIAIIIRWKTSPVNPPQILGELPEFHLIESTTDQIFGIEQLRGKIHVINFIFTRCNGPCPIMSQKFADMYKNFSDQNNVRFISISIDPKYDTSLVLNDYGKRYGINDSRWLFLRGEIADIVEFSKSGLKLAADDFPTAHSTRFILIDDNLRIRGYYDSQDNNQIELLEKHISLLAENIGL